MKPLLAWIALVVVGLLGLVWILPAEIKKIRTDQRFWRQADSEAPADVEGNVRSRYFVFKE